MQDAEAMHVESLELLEKLSVLMRERIIAEENERKEYKSAYNVFTVLLPAHDEVRLHTRFLHNLLDSEGTHDCGRLFFELFVETLQQSFQFFSVPLQERWEAGKEVAVGNGQIDLLFQSVSAVLVIENKIYAVEQDRQIARYCEYVASTHKSCRYILYLTLDGKESYTAEGNEYLRISYKEHVLKWLGKCLSETKAHPPIHEVIRQYKSLVESLVETENKEVRIFKEHLLKNPSLLQDWGKLSQGINSALADIRADLYCRVAEKLVNVLQKDFQAEIRKDVQPDFGRDPYGSIVLIPRDNFLVAMQSQIWIEHISKWNVLVIGLESAYKKLASAQEQPFLQDLGTEMKKRCQASGMHRSSEKQTWGGTHWPLGWHDLAKPFVAQEDLVEMLQEETLDRYVDEIVGKIKVYTEAVRELVSDIREGR